MKKFQLEGFCKKQDLQSSSANCCTIKKYFTAGFGCVLSMLVLSSNLNAQKSNFLEKDAFSLLREDAGWGNRLNDKSVNEIAPSYISSRIIKKFNKTFKNVNDARWFVLDKSFLAEFNKNGRKSTALFNKNGGIIYAISYGMEEHLPYEAKKMMKTCYYDYNITSATEVSVEWDSKAWIINLANNEKFIKVSFYDGNIYELENYNVSSKKKNSMANTLSIASTLVKNEH